MEPRATLNYDEENETRKTLKKQGYHFVGTHKHSAVKTCLWLRKSIRGEGNCYKGKFYGISAHRCVQMTPSIFCNQRCVHCWRPLEAFNINIRTEEVVWDSPEEIVEGCVREQRRLISGFKGSPKTNKDVFAEAEVPKHAAISLIGEPTLYPYLNELIQEFHSHGMTTFVVTNGTNPEVLREISPSQLYLSLNAPDEAIYKKVAHANYWSQIKESLKEMRRKMHIGYSRKRLPRNAMPAHSRVKEFASEIAEFLASASNYKIVDESEISRVVLISSGRKRFLQ
jgi:tRNA wybutosine-synthesizing protein 1